MKLVGIAVAPSAALCVDAQSLRSQIEASNRTTDELMRAKDVRGWRERGKAG